MEAGINANDVLSLEVDLFVTSSMNFIFSKTTKFEIPKTEWVILKSALLTYTFDDLSKGVFYFDLPLRLHRKSDKEVTKAVYLS